METPDIGALLGPYLAEVPAASLPRFLARLERGAADRYRHFAALLPDAAEGLLLCAAREDEIAERADALYPLVPADLKAIEAALPGARETYFGLFAELPIAEQLKLQASAERQGAAAWRGLAAGEADASLVAELEALAELELANSDHLEGLLTGGVN